jgi:2-polyprenyl-3-methyl-5-hydroxy-6-metoxy-1,4-benzoquinol methylase
MSRKSADSEPDWNTDAHPGFYSYYEEQSDGEPARRRFLAILKALMAAMGQPTEPLNVADIGCGAGTQSRLWAEHGHQVFGVDINKALVMLARNRARESGLDISFEVASATALPWPDRSMDLCIVPELLEHVANWRGCIAEFVRVLRPGGALYLSTSNKLCPLQEEFTLPLYSWYPAFVKRRCEELARTTHPELANYATYPAVNWFTYYGLRKQLRLHGLSCMDRFDLAAGGSRGRLGRAAIELVRRLPPLRFCAHVATPYTVLLAFKPGP